MTVLEERDDIEVELDDQLEDEGAPDEGPSQPGRRVDLVFLGAVLTAVGLSLILFLAYVYAFTGYKQTLAQHRLLNQFTTPAGSVPLSGKLPPDGAPAAILRIPALGLKQVVIQGTTAAETAQGPGTLSSAARPGTIGNAVIIGRLTTAGAPFAKLGELRKGDKITLVSGLGTFDYVVRRSGVASKGQRDPASPVNHAQLTLITEASPLSSSSERYVVADLKGGAGAAPKAKHRPVLSTLGLAGDPSALVPSILLGILYVAVLVGSIWSYHRYRSHLWTVYLLSTPILLAVALWWFENLYLLLPASY